MNNKVVIIGCGNVGMSYAYSIINQRSFVHELVLIDINEEKASGEAMDLNHGISFGPRKINIKAGNYSDCRDAKIVVIAAGANQNVGETRMDLIYKNNNIFKSIIEQVMQSGFKGIFMIATNPVDIMTYVTWKYSKLDSNRVIGTGTTLDSSRLRFEIGNELNISPKNVHAYVLGEHGDTEFVPWSNATIGLTDISEFIDENRRNEIESKVRNVAYDIIKKKGNTSYGIGMSMTRITNAILGNENSILTVSSYDKENDVFVGGPTILNQNGVSKRLFIPLTKEEEDKLSHSINTLKEAIKKLDIDNKEF